VAFREDIFSFLLLLAAVIDARLQIFYCEEFRIARASGGAFREDLSGFFSATYG
jgi:hypothetical protein